MRKAHLVGSIPGATAEEAMESALSRLASYLRSLSDGETGVRSSWIRSNIRPLYEHPDLETTASEQGDPTKYGGRPGVRVKDGHVITGESVAPYLAQLGAFEASYPRFRDLRDRHGRPDLSFQVGFPLHHDYAVGAFGPAGNEPEVYEACLDATARQIQAIHHRAGSDVIFQIETVAGSIAVTGADPDAQPAIARETATRLAELIARTPDGARFGVHLCVGDLNHKALGRLDNAAALVLLANAIAEAWPTGRSPKYIHVPFAAAAEPPVLEESFYAGLEELRLPGDTRFVAGFIHERVSLADTRRLLATIERRAGRQVDVAAACGLGRRADPAEAWDSMDKAAALLDPVRAVGA